MQPGEYNIPQHTKGDHYSWPVFQVFETAEDVKDITGCAIALWIRRGTAKGKIVHKLSTADGSIVVVDAALGKFRPDTTLVDWESGKYVYDIQLTESGIVQTIMTGTWIINEDVTK